MNKLKDLTFDNEGKELVARFLDGDKSLVLNMWIEDYKGDTLNDLSDSLQLWVDDLRHRANAESVIK